MFELGKVFVTAGVQIKLMESQEGSIQVKMCLMSHSMGNYGELDEFDTEQNDKVLQGGFTHGRILSKYTILNREIYIITEESTNGKITTVLLTSEY